MKYNNNPAKSLEKGEILPFVQQFWIWADRMKEMLYYVQDYIKSCLSPPRKADEIGIHAPILRRAYIVLYFHQAVTIRVRRTHTYQPVGVLHTKKLPHRSNSAGETAFFK
ncbi:hypothetical protein GC101_30320 [Paenibacillus sp. LMG 31459]|uniref:Uncharacterized protein n=1 Tax=Paenibacillus phytohabitans TaxID=2654978 RepID=A0ABX1YQI6_9BACL|nr:hypothetical protein [Paenibacillus phytohabitans]NOU83163.1 hypothetical protein [Paenibacillus phytohabitans]